jgi:hypothetical protein
MEVTSLFHSVAMVFLSVLEELFLAQHTPFKSCMHFSTISNSRTSISAAKGVLDQRLCHMIETGFLFGLLIRLGSVFNCFKVVSTFSIDCKRQTSKFRLLGAFQTNNNVAI